MNQPQRLIHDPIHPRGVPLGATVTHDGVNFALFSEHAEKIELCLFDESGEKELTRLPLQRGELSLWTLFVPDLAAGARYGYRVYGPYDPENGHRFNPNKLLLDPYARRIDRPLDLVPAHYGYTQESGDDLVADERDSAAFMPKCVVEAPRPERLSPLRLHDDPVIYEAHLRGLTQLHPLLSESQRGTFAGLAQTPIIDYLQALGIDAIELLPVQYAANETALKQRGLSNYWGYNSVAFFAPASHYLDGDSIDEVCAAVDALHDAGIEVILDVAFNHSGEGDEFGPTLCFRGIDNRSYYRMDPYSARYYVNDTGCGNTLNLSHPRVLQLVMDSLRYWAGTIGVDGFRFDLATTLARRENGFDAQAAFFQVLAQDPILTRVRLIAEPWDVGPGGYQLGNFPGGWMEWNDQYRDTVRRFWRGDAGQVGDLARRLHGSSDLFQQGRRSPRSSVNFVTCHDGFTLADLVSYCTRHNEANGEENRDGHRENFSSGYGAEGPTDNRAIRRLRERQRRNLLATLLLSQGTVMLLAGDELGRSQDGNNNAYCQDNELNWFPWEAMGSDEIEFLKFTADLIDLRKQLSLLRWPQFLHGPSDEVGPYCQWLSQRGDAMNDHDWRENNLRCLGMLISSGSDEASSAVLLVLNANEQNMPFSLPSRPRGGSWRLLLDTAAAEPRCDVAVEKGSTLMLSMRSLCLLEYHHKDL